MRLTKLLMDKIGEWEKQTILNVQAIKLINNTSPYHDIFTRYSHLIPSYA